MLTRQPVLIGTLLDAYLNDLKEKQMKQNHICGAPLTKIADGDTNILYCETCDAKLIRKSR